MDDSASLEDSSMTIVQADSTIAFAYIKELQSKKKRFYVLKCQPRRPGSPSSEFDTTSRSASISLPPNFFLYAYKNKKYFERGDAKRVYDLTNVILLSRCTKKANKTILGVCFQDDALFLKFDTEDELSRWYFHLNEIFSTKRNCLWPELKQCFSVTLKNKELASAAARHGKANLPGQYRFCLTESAVLLVKDDLLNPVLSLPFPCIRSCVHSMTSNFFQIHLGRLSPIGEGVLHFEAEQSTLLKEIIENLLRCLSEASSKDLECVKARKNRRNSRQNPPACGGGGGSGSGSAVLLEDYQSQRPASMHCCSQRASCANCGSTRASVCNSASSALLKPSQSNGGLGSLALADGSGSGSCGGGGGGSRGYSLPPPDCLSQCSSAQQPPSQQQQQPQADDYCLMELTASGCGGFPSRSPNSSMSLSTASEVTGGGVGVGGGGGGCCAESDRALSAASSVGQRSLGPDERAARLARVSTWRYCDAHLQHHQQQQQQQQQQLVSQQGSPVIRANSIGCRPMSRGLLSQYPTAHHYQQQQQQQSPHPPRGPRYQQTQPQQQQQQNKTSSSQQVFVELSFPRPRTTSDAASHHHCCPSYSANSGSSGYASARSFRPRARSYGNKFGRPVATDAAVSAAAAAAEAAPCCGCCSYCCDAAGSSGASPAPSLALSGGMRPLSESTASSSGELGPSSTSQQQQLQVAPQRRHQQPADDEGSYVTMLLRPTKSCLRQNSEPVQREDRDDFDGHHYGVGVGVGGFNIDEEDFDDPYWMPPGPLETLLDAGKSTDASVALPDDASSVREEKKEEEEAAAAEAVTAVPIDQQQGDYFMMDVHAAS